MDITELIQNNKQTRKDIKRIKKSIVKSLDSVWSVKEIPQIEDLDSFKYDAQKIWKYYTENNNEKDAFWNIDYSLTDILEENANTLFSVYENLNENNLIKTEFSRIFDEVLNSDFLADYNFDKDLLDTYFNNVHPDDIFYYQSEDEGSEVLNKVAYILKLLYNYRKLSFIEIRLINSNCNNYQYKNIKEEKKIPQILNNPPPKFSNTNNSIKTILLENLCQQRKEKLQEKLYI